MARGDKDSLFFGFHGRINDQIVIKQRNGKPVLCFYPKRDKVKWTENQKLHRREFKMATMYAKMIMKNSGKRLFYEEREHDGINVWNLAIADFLIKPVINSIHIRKARGFDQYLIQVLATDNFLITGVRIDLFDLSGIFMEQVHATQFRHTDRWMFRINSEKLSTVGHIKALAKDNVGHCATMEYMVGPEDLKRLPHSYNKATG